MDRVSPGVMLPPSLGLPAGASEPALPVKMSAQHTTMPTAQIDWGNRSVYGGGNVKRIGVPGGERINFDNMWR